MNIKDVTAAIERICPLSLAQDWDNVGLLVGKKTPTVQRLMLTIDTTRAVVAEAKQNKVDLILSYHPVIWEGLKAIGAQGPTAPVYDLIQAGIGVFVIHTAYDAAFGGVNDALAAALGIMDPKPIGDYLPGPAGPHYKVVTFVPEKDVDKVANALYEAGAGVIGNYSHCGFQTTGTGTFLPLKGSHPTIGRPGRRETVPEIKIESVVTSRNIKRVIEALRKAHPYQTPAFDVFRHYDVEQRLGLGRMGALPRATQVTTLLDRLKRATGVKTAGIVGLQQRRIHKAAVCAGSCSKIIQQVIAAGCELYVTGELSHHLALASQEAGLTTICLSHSVSERFALKNLAKQLKKELPGVKIGISKKDKDPFQWKQI